MKKPSTAKNTLVEESNPNQRGGSIARRQDNLKLGKRATFVKSSLKRLPKEKDIWEADFRALPKTKGRAETDYLGVVVALPKGHALVFLVLHYRPTVNDLADLLADAMLRPLTGPARRPQNIIFRANPRWEELYAHLKDIGIETSVHDDLPKVEEAYADFLREMRKANPGPLIMLSPRPTNVDEEFPAIALWIKDGYIEIGNHDDMGFVVRALDEGGLVLEDSKPQTLAEAMAALEAGLKAWFEERGFKVG